MAQDTHHHSEQHSEQHTHQTEKKSIVSVRSSFWFVIIIVGLFIASLNFINVMSNDNGEGNKITDVPKPVEPAMEATSSQTLMGEKGQGRPVNANKTNMYRDSLNHDKH